MEFIKISELVKSRRKELGVTQEQLCEGICEPVTISRIENGKQIPSPKHLLQIFERLNIPIEYLIAYVSDETHKRILEKEQILKDIYNCLMISEIKQNREINRIKNKIDRIHENGDISEQFYYVINMIFNNKVTNEDVKNCLNKILKTQPSFSIEKISELLLTNDEFYLILLLGIMFYQKSDIESCQRVFHNLLGYLNRIKNLQIISENNKMRYLFLNVVYITLLKKIEEFNQAIIIGEEILRLCQNNFHYYFLGILYETLAECKEAIHDESSNTYYKKAIAFYFSTNNQFGLERLESKNIKLSKNDMFSSIVKE